MFLSTEEISALKLSSTFSICAATIGTTASIALGYWLSRSRVKWKWLVESAANLPLVLPPVVTGYILLVLLAPSGPIGKIFERFGFKIVFTPYAAVIAAAIVSFPLALRTIKLAFESIDTEIEKTALTLGASKKEVFFEISLPLAKNGIIAGWLLAFARSLGEFGATIMIAGNIAGRTQTIPLAIFSRAMQPGGIEQSWRLVVLSIIISCIAIAFGESIGKGKFSKHRKNSVKSNFVSDLHISSDRVCITNRNE
ncbi:MAG: molybdate ABC transporter permease subunit [Sedimentisphaerales bacterium]|nr:molybdate ABC transporter permease subunit [Sedimentisphaerales bacterium]